MVQILSGPPSLLALTAVSNISNSKISSPSVHELSNYARELGYTTLLDAAALAPTGSVDIVAVSPFPFLPATTYAHPHLRLPVYSPILLYFAQMVLTWPRASRSYP